MLSGLRFFALIGAVMLFSCDPSLVYSDYAPVSDGWAKQDEKKFSFTIEDTLSRYHLFLLLRNDDSYPYSNIFLITKFRMPNDYSVTDTLEYAMATPDGRWLGSGITSKESKLWYREGVRFPQRGVYQISISQAMRRIGQIDGILRLPGITAVGVRVEKSE